MITHSNYLIVMTTNILRAFYEPCMVLTKSESSIQCSKVYRCELHFTYEETSSEKLFPCPNHTVSKMTGSEFEPSSVCTPRP